MTQRILLFIAGGIVGICFWDLLKCLLFAERQGSSDWCARCSKSDGSHSLVGRNAVRVITGAKDGRANAWADLFGIEDKISRISKDWRIRVSVAEAGRDKWMDCLVDVALVEDDILLTRDDLGALLMHSRRVYRIKELTSEDFNALV